MRKLLLIILFCPLIILAVWIVSIDRQSKDGIDIKVRITGYDPRDILSGHYISYQIDWDKTDCSQFPDKECLKKEFCHENRWGTYACRFYIPEESSGQLDELFRTRNSDNLKFEVIYSYNPSRKAIAKQLLINDKDWREALKETK